MRIEIPYGRKKVEAHVKDVHVGEIVYPNFVRVQPSRSVLENALNRPIRSPSFQNFLENASDLLVIVNDATRPTPTAGVLDLIVPKLKRIPVKFIVATGCHRAPTEDELKMIFGAHYPFLKKNIYIHDADKQEEMVALGVSKNGTVMEVNRLGVEAGSFLIIGSVEPHYFAGYTGGRKAFLPGIASYKTIEQNHKLAMLPSARAMVLQGNPVHEDMEDAIHVIRDKPIFSIMTVLDREDRIYAATAGDLTESLQAAIDRSNEVFSVPIKEKSDVVVAVAPYPMDVDLYQSQKAIENGKLALNPGGILILVSQCRSGVGHDTFAQLLAGSEGPEEALERIADGYRLGYHKAAKIAEICQWAQIWGVTSIQPEIMRSIFIRPFVNVQKALDAALAEKKDAKILFLMAASVTVPRLR